MSTADCLEPHTQVVRMSGLPFHMRERETESFGMIRNIPLLRMSVLVFGTVCFSEPLKCEALLAPILELDTRLCSYPLWADPFSGSLSLSTVRNTLPRIGIVASLSQNQRPRLPTHLSRSELSPSDLACLLRLRANRKQLFKWGKRENRLAPSLISIVLEDD